MSRVLLAKEKLSLYAVEPRARGGGFFYDMRIYSMAGRLPYLKRKYYPHMTGEDGAIWDRFVDKFPQSFETVDYDYRVGEGAEIPPETDEKYSRMITMLSQKRIDVIGWKDEYPTIIEVKKRVGLSTLGQVLGYQALFSKEFPHLNLPELMVVCEMISSDDRAVLEKYRIKIEVV